MHRVHSYANLPADLAGVSIPSQKYLVFPHREHVSKLHEMCRIAGEWLAANGHEIAKSAGAPAFFERYTEEFNSSTGMGGMEAWFPVKS
jgi:AraC family transcriptional regulator